jgi:hypothetical protein
MPWNSAKWVVKKLYLWRKKTVSGGKGAQLRWWRRDKDAAREFEEVTLKRCTPLSVEGRQLSNARHFPLAEGRGFFPSLS